MRNRNRKRQNGFTLLELVVVVAVLGLVTSLATSMVIEDSNQKRFELTKQRITEVREAIVGAPNLKMNGEPVFGGYIADMGAVPDQLRKLVQKEYCSDAQYIRQTDCVSPATWVDQGSGWKGPYLRSYDMKTTIIGGVEYRTPVFRDGWGTESGDGTEDNKQYGWKFTASSGSDITLQSYGLDGTAGQLSDSHYDREFPEESVLITAAQYAGVGVTVKVKAASESVVASEYCLVADFTSGVDDPVDFAIEALPYEGSIDAKTVFGFVTAEIKKKSLGSTDCSALEADAIVSGKFYAHNLYTGSSREIVLTLP